MFFLGGKFFSEHCMTTKRLAIVPGDGIGVDVTREVVRALELLKQRGLPLEWQSFDYSADTYLKTGVALPPGGMAELGSFDAIFMGAFGDPRVPDMAHAKAILLGARFELDLYVNHRPTKLYHPSLTPLKGVEKTPCFRVILPKLAFPKSPIIAKCQAESCRPTHSNCPTITSPSPPHAAKSPPAHPRYPAPPCASHTAAPSRRAPPRGAAAAG